MDLKSQCYNRKPVRNTKECEFLIQFREAKDIFWGWLSKLFFWRPAQGSVFLFENSISVVCVGPPPWWKCSSGKGSSSVPFIRLGGEVSHQYLFPSRQGPGHCAESWVETLHPSCWSQACCAKYTGVRDFSKPSQGLNYWKSCRKRELWILDCAPCVIYSFYVREILS